MLDTVYIQHFFGLFNVISAVFGLKDIQSWKSFIMIVQKIMSGILIMKENQDIVVLSVGWGLRITYIKDRVHLWKN